MDRGRFLNNILNVIKLFLGIIFLVPVYALTLSFYHYLFTLDFILANSFLAGIISFLVIFIFIWPPHIIYKTGQQILEKTFKFFVPLVKVASYLLPIYTILIFIIGFFYFYFTNNPKAVIYTIFLIGFTLTLHLVFTAFMLRPMLIELDRIANYIFSFSIIYILNMVLCAWFFMMLNTEFDFVSFFANAYNISEDIYTAVFVQLFSVNR